MNDSKKKAESGVSAINHVFVAFIAFAVCLAAFTNNMGQVSKVSFDAAKDAVTLAIGLIGIMALWLGFMRVLEAGGLMLTLARCLKPITVRLFPDVPPEHPAMSAMILNMSANMLGLGNAATPFGLKAMTELNRLNPFKGTATNAMCMFLAINTSSIALLPLGVIGVRAAEGCLEPAAIFLPGLIATSASTLVGISAALFLARRDKTYLAAYRAATEDQPAASSTDSVQGKEDLPDYSSLLSTPGIIAKVFSWTFLLIFFLALIYNALTTSDLLAFLTKDVPTHWLMPMLMLLIVCYGMARGVKIYEAVTEGAKQGFEIAVRIIPFLVAILVAIAMLRESVTLFLQSDLVDLSSWKFLTEQNFLPLEVLPMALIRPLSGSGAFGVMSDLVQQAPNSYNAFLASIMSGSTETTFYVLAVYFGSAGIVKIRHALTAALLADATGILTSCVVARIFWG